MRPFLALVFLIAACGGGGGTNSDMMGDDMPIDAAPDAFVPPAGFARLIGRSWSLQPGATDTYRCARLTIAADTYVTNIIAQAPTGTHHTVLSISDGNTTGPDGEYNCNVSELGMVMLYASGVGTSPLDFPSGVGVKIAAGTQIHLNLHLFNASDQPINGDTAILVKSQPTPTSMLAEMVFAGRFGFSIGPNAQNAMATGGCTSDRAFNLFAVWPHQHQLGTKHKFEIIRGGTPNVLHDAPFSFSEQNYYLKSPIVQVMQGDQIRTTCYWTNTTNQTITFGESSNKEMCFTGMYRYPAANTGLFQCTDVPNGL